MRPTDSYLKTIRELRSWIKRSHYTTATFASAIGMTLYNISWVLHDRKKGRRYFTTEQASAIESLTGGDFMASDLLFYMVPEGYELRKIEEDDDDIIKCRKAFDVLVESRKEVTA